MKPRMIPILCSGCHHAFEIRRDTVLIAGFDETAEKRLEEESYFLHQCSKCRKLFDMAYPFYYRKPGVYSILLSMDTPPAGMDFREPCVQVSTPRQLYLIRKILNAGLDIPAVLYAKKQLEERCGRELKMDRYDPQQQILWFTDGRDPVGTVLKRSK